MQVLLKNAEGNQVAKGVLVKFVKGRTDSFILASVGDLAIVGTTANVIPNNSKGLVNLLNTVDWADVMNTPSSQGLSNSFETVSKNLKGYPYVITYSGSDINYITYTTPTGTIVKTFGYSLGVLTSLTLSGATPSGVSLTKALHYTGSDLTSVSYS